MANKRLLRVDQQDNYYLDDPKVKQKQERLKKKSNLRIIILFSLFFVAMLIIVAKLYSLQILEHEKYLQVAITQFDETRKELPTRGEIIDAKGRVLVSNTQRLSFIYLPPKTETTETSYQKAKDFVSLFDADISTMTLRDKQDAYVFNYPKEAEKLITADEQKQYSQGTLSSDDIYQLQLSRITPSLIDSALSQQQLKEFYIYAKMQSRIGLDVVLKESITPYEVNLLSENKQKFTGIEVRINWDRITLPGNNLKAILGDMTTNRQGLLSDTSKSMQALDYKLNDRIGRSGLEQQYETLLSGKRTEYSLTYSQDGLVNLKESNSGQKGDTIQLTIDTEFQKKIEDIVSNFLINNSGNYGRELFNQMVVVVSNPNNGNVLASVGAFINDENEIELSPSAPYLNAYLPGSSIKGAVVYLALDQEIFYPGQLVLDEPIKIQGTNLKASSSILGEVNDLTALSKSSNVYMFKTAITLGKGVYEYDKPLDIDPLAFETIRSNFSQFGLGVETGLDVPSEERGFQSNSTLPGHLLDYVIGQYDSYTAMQLNQYVSTIANGKYRYKMRLVENAFNPDTHEIDYQNEVQILNSIDNEMAIQRVQQGFRLCVTDGYCDYLKDAIYPIAAKTGTAEDFYIDKYNVSHPTNSNTLIAYAPFDNPQVAVSCIAPHFMNLEVRDFNWTNGCQQVVKEIMNYHAQYSQSPSKAVENQLEN